MTPRRIRLPDTLTDDDRAFFDRAQRILDDCPRTAPAREPEPHPVIPQAVRIHAVLAFTFAAVTTVAGGHLAATVRPVWPGLVLVAVGVALAVGTAAALRPATRHVPVGRVVARARAVAAHAETLYARPAQLVHVASRRERHGERPASPTLTNLRPIADMAVGETAYTVSWAMVVTHGGRCVLRPDYPADLAPGGTFSLKVTRRAGGFAVDVSGERAYVWTVDEADLSADCYAGALPVVKMVGEIRTKGPA